MRRFAIAVRWMSSSTILVAAVAVGGGTDEDAPGPDLIDARGLEHFESRIRPILVEHCLECHGDDPDSLKGGLDLSSAAGIRRGGESGLVLRPGNPGESPLHLAVTYADQEFAMPPRGRLSDQEIEAIRIWIEMGAPDPRLDEVAEIDAGAARDPWRDPYGQGREHWAYRPMSESRPPSASDDHWSRNDIDRFIFAGLQEAGIDPAPDAAPRTLARRAFFDLVGLPPTPEEMRIFLEDHAEDAEGAWSRLVDRLLESPHHGERWGRHWLDVARYADSNGLDENTAFGNAWRYRDWVVRAFNEDLPYDQFVRMQLAGDLLPEPSEADAAVDNLIATGFLSLGPKVLAEPDKEKMLVDIVDEQVDVVTKAFLAQTVGCARCHDHKFDPVTHADYYAMAGILISTRTMENLNTVAKVRERPLARQEEIENARAHAEALRLNQSEKKSANEEGSRRLGETWANRTADAMLATLEIDSVPPVREAENFDASNLGVNLDQWGSGVGVLHTIRPNVLQFVEYEIDAADGGRWHVLARYASGEGRPIRILAANDVLAEEFCGDSTGSFDVETLRWTSAVVDLPPGTERLRFERSGSFPHLDRLVLVSEEDLAAFESEVDEVAARHQLDPPLLRRWSDALARESIFDSWRRYAEIPATSWSEDVVLATNELQERYASEATSGDGNDVSSGVTPAETPFVRSLVAGPAPRSIEAIADRWQAASSLVLDTWERHRTSAEGEAASALPDGAQERFRLALVGPTGVLRLGEDIAAHYPEALRARIAQLAGESERLIASAPPMIPTGIVVEEAEIRDLPIFVRGDHRNQQDETVPRGYLTVLKGRAAAPLIPETSSGRLELAEWMTDAEHPLTARAIVNRVWAWHFGDGIVATPSNFGLRGGRPTHPELLDWLARRFVAEGWSIKDLHRWIMGSRSYRLSGATDPQAMEVDPGNDLRWRRTPRRIEAELVRDAILAVGDSLDRTVGGSLLRTGNFGYVTNDQSRSNERYDASRRALYMPVIRNDMYELFATFDYTDPSVSFGRRPSTVVAQQSLFMMNSPLVASQAERLARRVLESPERQSDEERIELAYEICFARPASQVEIGRAIDFIAALQGKAGETPSVPWPPAGSMDGDPEMIAPRLHAWRSLCKVLIASNEFIYVR